jgi:hypothetical protein
MRYVEIKNGVVISGPWIADELPNLAGSGVTPMDITSISPEPQECWTYDGATFTEGFPAAILVPIEDIRKSRDTLLSESDWRDLPSYQGTDQVAWRTYRQELRDLPENYVPTSSPLWPSPPS